MSLNFRDIVMGAISSVGENALVTKESIEREKVKPTYKCDASGIDLVITRMLGEKETRKLYLILSQTDENGRPLVYIKDGKKNIIPTENMVYSFLDGKYRDEYIQTGSTVIPKLRKDKTFIQSLLNATTAPGVIELFKKGLMNMEMIWSWDTRRGGYYTKPWFLKYTGDSTIGDIVKNGGYVKENVHMSLIKEGMRFLRESGEYSSDEEMLRQLFTEPYRNSDEILERKHLDITVMRTFVILANRYDEPFALNCMKDYLSNGFLGNIATDKLAKLLTIKKEIDPLMWDKYTNRHYYDNYKDPRYVMRDLTIDRLTKEEENQVIMFEKNRLWEYLKSSKDEGYGFEMADFIDTWHDYAIMKTVMDGKLRNKYPDYLYREHKLLINRRKLVMNDIKTKVMMDNTKIPAKICETKVGDYEFKIMKSPADIYEEATTQRNCLADCYLESSVDGETIIGSLRYKKKDEDRRRITIEIRPEDYKFVQIKAFANASDFTKEEQEAIDKASELVHKKFLKYQAGELKIEDEPKQEVLAA